MGSGGLTLELVCHDLGWEALKVLGYFDLGSAGLSVGYPQEPEYFAVLRQPPSPLGKPPWPQELNLHLVLTAKTTNKVKSR